LSDANPQFERNETIVGIKLSHFGIESDPESADIPIAPLDSRIVGLLLDNTPDGSKNFCKMFDYNCQSAIRNHFIRTATSTTKEFSGDNEFDDCKHEWKPFLQAIRKEVGIVPKPSYDSLVSNSILSEMLKDLTTDLRNIYSGNILYKMTQHVLRKLFNHRFAPERTSRHLQHLKERKPGKSLTRRNQRKRLKARQKSLLTNLERVNRLIDAATTKPARVPHYRAATIRIVERLKVSLSNNDASDF
jgi:hypothetical protein